MPADVRRDRRQHVVAGQQRSVGRVEQAEVVLGVARRVHGHPVAARQRDRLGVVEPEVRPQLDAPEHAPLVGRRSRHVAAPRRAPLEHTLVELLLAADDRLEGVEVVGLGRIPEHAEGAVADDTRLGVVVQPDRAAEVVRVAVRHDDRVHPGQRDPGELQATEQCVVRLWAGETGVDEGETLAVLEHVAVDVAQPGHVDRQLHPQHTGRDLGDLLRRPLLFLATGSVGGGRLLGGADRGVGVMLVVLHVEHGTCRSPRRPQWERPTRPRRGAGRRRWRARGSAGARRGTQPRLPGAVRRGLDGRLAPALAPPAALRGGPVDATPVGGRRRAGEGRGRCHRRAGRCRASPAARR